MVADPLFFTANGKVNKINRLNIKFRLGIYRTVYSAYCLCRFEQIHIRYVSTQSVIDIELYVMVADPLFFTANGKATKINRFDIKFGGWNVIN